MAEPKTDEENQRRPIAWLWPALIGIGVVLLAAFFLWPKPTTEVAAPPPPSPVAERIVPTPTPEPTPEPVEIAVPTPEPAAAVANIDPMGRRPEPSPTEEPASKPIPASRTHASVKQPGTRAPDAEPPQVKTIVPKTIAPPEKPGPVDRRPLEGPKGDVEGAIAKIKKCPTMQACIQAADVPLEMYGHFMKLTDPGVATIDTFDEVRSNYRRAQAEALRAAKELAGRPGGNKHEPQLRAIFEAIPKSDTWSYDEDELRSIRVAIERTIERFTRERRVYPDAPIALQVRVLTPAGGQRMQIDFDHGGGTFSGMTDLKEFIRRELVSAKEIKNAGRQRLASVKVVINPGASHAVD